MADTFAVERGPDGLSLVDDRFPWRARFSVELLQTTVEMRPRGDLIHVKLANARAVYRMVLRQTGVGIVEAELVYAEYQ